MAVPYKTRLHNFNRMIKIYEDTKKKKGKDFASEEDLSDMKKRRAQLIKDNSPMRDVIKNKKKQ